MTKRSEFTPKQKAQAMLNCGGRCENKHCEVKLTKSTVNYDHILSDKICRDQGIKSNTDDNIQCLCVDCHVKIKSRADMGEIVKRRKQDKKYSGDASADGEVKAASPPNKSQWGKREMASRKFDKPKEGYRYKWK